MEKPFIVLGDSTDHGGKVIAGSPSSDINGKPIARMGDKVTCPIKGHGGVTTIISGDHTNTIDGMPAARHGDKTACGATLISSQTLVTTGGPDGGIKGTPAPKAPAAKPATPPSAAELKSEFNDFYQLKNGQGEVMKSANYAVEFPDGAIQYGTTDASGYTNLHVTAEEAKALIFYVQGA